MNKVFRIKQSQEAPSSEAKSSLLATYLFGSQNLTNVDVGQAEEVMHVSQEGGSDVLITAMRMQVESLKRGEISVHDLTSWLDQLALTHSGVFPASEINGRVLREMRQMPQYLRPAPMLSLIN